MPKDRPKQIGLMKAKPLEDNLISKLTPSCFAQRKFRGQHAMTRWVDNEFPVLISSYGNTFHYLSRIEAYLRSLPPLPYVGELYCHDLSQQDINSILNRTVNPHPDVDKVQYIIFDLATDEPQSVRFMQLDTLDLPALNSIFPVAYAGYELITPGYWSHYAAKYLREGYEGIILRDLYAPYSPLDPQALAKRPSTILKWKPNETDEYKIVACIEGTGWAEGMLGSFLVEDESGVQFSVGTGRVFTKANRKRLWDQRYTLPGRTLVTKHEANINTADGIPICTSGWEVI